MKTPLWESSAGALMALMFPSGRPNRTLTFAQLYTFNLITGEVLRYATGDRAITYPGAGGTWDHNKVRIDTMDNKAVVHYKTGLDADTYAVTLMPRLVDDLSRALYPDTIGGQPWIAAALAGALDGATVFVDEAYFNGWPPPSGGAITPVGVLPLFAGLMADVAPSRSGVSIIVNSHLELLGVNMPRRLYQEGCIHTLFDGDCTLNAATFARTGTVATVTDRTHFTSAVAAPLGSGDYTLGQVVFTAGNNAGFSEMVAFWDSATGLFTLRAALPYAIQPGDAMTVYPGCDKTQATCTKFANIANYGGTPYVPPPETAV